jgi:hypothetical protein
MKEKGQKLLLICLEVISLAILLPIFYWGTVKLLLGPVEKAFYPHDLYEHRIITTWMVFVFILVFNVIWFMLMKLCPRDKIHVKAVLTLLILAFSAAILTCFIIVDALTGAFA